MSKPSIFAEFKTETHSLELNSEWIYYSLETPELSVLEKVVTKDEDKFLIQLNKHFGVRAFENHEVKDSHDAFKACEKEFWYFLDKICESTGLTRYEAYYQVPEDLEVNILELQKNLQEVLEEAEKEERKVKSLEVRQEIVDIKKQTFKESKEIKKELEPFQADLKAKTDALESARKDYYFALVISFLNGKRCQSGKGEFTREVLDKLHPGLQQAFVSFVTSEINGWDKSEGKN